MQLSSESWLHLFFVDSLSLSSVQSPTAPAVSTSSTPPEDLSKVKENPFGDLKEIIAREKLSFDKIVEVARNTKLKFEESDEIFENYEDNENCDYECDWEEYSDGEETL